MIPTPHFTLKVLSDERKEVSTKLENKQIKILKRKKEKDLEEYEGMKAGGDAGKKN